MPFSGMAIYFPEHERWEDEASPEEDNSDYVRVNARVSIPYEIVDIKSDGSAVLKVLDVSRVTRKGAKGSKEDKKPNYERRLGYIGRIGVETFSVSSLSGATILLGPSQCRSLEEDQKKSPDDKLQVLEGEEIDIRERLRNMTITPLSFVSNPYRSESFGIDVDIVEETTGEESGVTSGRVACYFDDHGNIAGEINIQERPRNVSNGRRLGKSQIA